MSEETPHKNDNSITVKKSIGAILTVIILMVFINILG